jgi:hypothetical protein
MMNVRKILDTTSFYLLTARSNQPVQALIHRRVELVVVCITITISIAR